VNDNKPAPLHARFRADHPFLFSHPQTSLWDECKSAQVSWKQDLEASKCDMKKAPAPFIANGFLLPGLSKRAFHLKCPMPVKASGRGSSRNIDRSVPFILLPSTVPPCAVCALTLHLHSECRNLNLPVNLNVMIAYREFELATVFRRLNSRRCGNHAANAATLLPA